MAPKHAAAAAAETPSSGAAETESSSQDAAWVATLSEKELVIDPDFLIGLRELAATRATNAGHPKLADKFDLPTLRALGIVLLQVFKERLVGDSYHPKMAESLVLLTNPGKDLPHKSGYQGTSLGTSNS